MCSKHLVNEAAHCVMLAYLFKFMSRDTVCVLALSTWIVMKPEGGRLVPLDAHGVQCPLCHQVTLGPDCPASWSFHLLSLTTPSALDPCTPFLVPHLHMVESKAFLPSGWDPLTCVSWSTPPLHSVFWDASHYPHFPL